jgi:Fic family protein
MRQWELWVNTAHAAMSPVVEVALGHYQFETLHPFNDGNGRIGRLLVVLQLMSGGVLTHPLLTVSPWLEARRTSYQDHLLNVSATGDFDPWVRFFAEALCARADATTEVIAELIAFQQELRDLVTRNRLKGTSTRLVDYLIAQPVITVPWVQRVYEVTFPAANNAVSRLVEAGVLHEMTGRAYGRVFGARRVLEIVGGI